MAQDDIKSQLTEARRLAKAGKIKEARSLLAEIDHPKAKEWLGLLPVRSSASGLSYPIAGAALVVTLIVALGLGVLLGRELLRREIASAFTGAFATDDPNTLSGFESAGTEVAATTAAMQITPTLVPVGGELLGRLSVKVIAIERPSTLEVSATFGADVEAVAGAEFVGVRIEVTCAATEVTCYTGSADPSLVLKDGRVVEVVDASFSSYVVPDSGDDEVIGGRGLTVWRVYEVPKGAELSHIIYEDSIGALPQ